MIDPLIQKVIMTVVGVGLGAAAVFVFKGTTAPILSFQGLLLATGTGLIATAWVKSPGDVRPASDAERTAMKSVRPPENSDK